MRASTTSKSRHAEIRMQQRSIPEIGVILLRDYGQRTRAPGNCYRYFFEKKSWREVVRLMGPWPLKKMDQLRKAYIIESEDGTIVTTGYAT